MIEPRPFFTLLATTAVVLSANSRTEAATVLGAGSTAAGDFLLGNDLTDPENDGAPDLDSGYNATFSGNEEANFGGGEGAFNIFDNRVGGGNDKWCCGSGGANLPFWVDATFPLPVVMSHFTLTNGNDTVPGRDPRAWRIQGSNDQIN
jgi:hypothetical protein